MSIDAHQFVSTAKDSGIGLFTGVPCSLLGSVFEAVEQTARYVAATNEGEAVALAAGASIGGVLPCVLMQNSGLGNAVNPLSSLSMVAKTPALLVIGWRGEPSAQQDEPQHRLMGAITTALLDLLGIHWERLASDQAQALLQLQALIGRMRSTQLPCALVVPRGIFSSPQSQFVTSHFVTTQLATSTRPRRTDFLRAVSAHAGARDVLVATTGHTARELEAIADKPNQLYVVGAMGCASSVALGLALCRPNHRVWVLDGEGAVLMRLSALALIGEAQPKHLVHFVFDNGVYASTGGQPVAAPHVDLLQIARGCGYKTVMTLESLESLATFFANVTHLPGPIFARIPVSPESESNLARPALQPHEVSDRLRGHLERTSL